MGLKEDFDNAFKEELNKRADKIGELEAAIMFLEGQINILHAQVLTYVKKKDYIDANTPDDFNLANVWCADLSESLTGEVGTIEIPGEVGVVQIQPNGPTGDAAVYDGERDGQLTPTVTMTPAQAFYNLAILPGWQKWNPLYRHGIITGIDTDADTATVELSECISSQGGLDVRFPDPDPLTDVPISYMTCNSNAFQVGDEVLVKFGESFGQSPSVIGFKENPRLCSDGDLLFICQNAMDYTIWGFTENYIWTQLPELPISGVPYWVSLAWDGSHYFVQTFDPMRVWKLDTTTLQWEEFFTFNFPDQYSSATYFIQATFIRFLGDDTVYLRPYVNHDTERDLWGLNLQTGEWALEAQFQDSGGRNSGNAQYFYWHWPAWDGTYLKMIWHDYSVYGDYPFWSRYGNNGVSYPGSLLAPGLFVQPGRILYANGETYAEGADHSILKNNGDQSVIRKYHSPGFHWSRQAISTGEDFICKNEDDQTVWRFDGADWEQVADSPGFYWRDPKYVGELNIDTGLPAVDTFTIT